MGNNDPVNLAASIGSLNQRARIAAFWAIHRGETPSPVQLSEQLGVSETEVRSAIQHLFDAGLMTVDDELCVTGSHGLSLVPSDHRVSFDVGLRYVWCAVDAVGIPAALRANAEISSRCFQCGSPITLTIETGQPLAPAADTLRIGIGVPGRSGKVIEDLCPTLNFFCSEEHSRAWAASVGGANVITIRHAAELGRTTWADVL